MEMYRNRQVHAGESILKQVNEKDEWCAEAYMETDYSIMTQNDYEKTIKNYLMFKLMNGFSESNEEVLEEEEG